MALIDPDYYNNDQTFPKNKQRFYPAYCYSNSKKGLVFPIWCSNQLFLTVLCVVSGSLICFLLFKHIKKHKTKKYVKTLTLTSMLLLQFFVFLHYTMIWKENALQVIFALQQALLNCSYLGICYMSCKQCGRLLNHTKKIYKFLRILTFVSVSLVLIYGII